MHVRPQAARRIAVLATISLTAGIVPSFVSASPAAALSNSVVISQVYGGGGNIGATYTNDFIELFNRGTSAVSLDGWSVQYASSGGMSWAMTPLSGTLASGQYYLVAEALGTGGTTPLPTPDVAGTIPIAATNGKVALRNTTVTIPSGVSCPAADSVDFVGFGSANCFEGSGATPALTNTTAALRAGGGCTETDDNAGNFATGAPTPRNTATPLAPCGVVVDEGPTVTAISPSDGSSGVAPTSDVSVTFSEPVTLTGTWFTLDCTVSGSKTATVTGGPTTFTLNPDADFAVPETCTLRIIATAVTDQDTTDPPDAMAADVVSTFSTTSLCAATPTPAYAIQGSGAATPLSGVVTTRGVVVGDYEGPAGTTLRGFYVQDATGDADPATSDAVFVFNGSADAVNVGDDVAVTGTVGEFQDQTQVSASRLEVCGVGTVAASDVTFPVPDAAHLERYEGMLVRLPQTMYVTEHFQLGRFGQVVLSSGDRLAQPTNVTTPGAAANALQAANNLNKIILDDASQAQNPDPILFARGGQPLSASNTLRGGDTATGIVGVMTYTWAGNAASGNAYRVRPVGALGGVATFDAVNPRPGAAAPTGSLRVGAMNLLNYFNTFDGLPDNVDNCNNGVGGPATDCRGADTQSEFDRQWPKTVAAIIESGVDAVGINEIENDGYGAASAIQHLVAQLNAATAPGTYAFVDVDAATGQVNALGTDAIKVGLVYKPAKVTPVGQTAALNTAAFVNGGDPSPRNRATVAQAFLEKSSGSVFVMNVNHLKSKGSACTAPDAGDGQGNCNAVRTQAATELAAWLATDPTGTGDPDVLIIGDLNSYAMEDPVTTLKNAGYVNLIEDRIGADAYSYVFDGQWGYLDHALATPSIASQVSGVTEWHINADEPSVLDYNTDFKTPNLIASLYAPDRFRVSDHDPVLVDLALSGPARGVVAGGGRFESPAGAYTGNPTASATATVAVAASYVRGRPTPIGATILTLTRIGLLFTSTNVDWLVVNPATTSAQYAGTGRVNGQTGYSFMVWVDDAAPDTVRIRIWNTASGALVYDNGTTALTSGAIVVRS
ncbi:MAG: ExeM/NucH family extracellular endonuclease [Acidimicrobiia bacterium]